MSTKTLINQQQKLQANFNHFMTFLVYYLCSPFSYFYNFHVRHKKDRDVRCEIAANKWPDVWVTSHVENSPSYPDRQSWSDSFRRVHSEGREQCHLATGPHSHTQGSDMDWTDSPNTNDKYWKYFCLSCTPHSTWRGTIHQKQHVILHTPLIDLLFCC